MRRAGHRPIGGLAVLDRTGHHLQAGSWVELPVVTQRPHLESCQALILRLSSLAMNACPTCPPRR